MTITVSPFTTSRDANGAYSLTLAQLTSVFLAEIEKLFGPRDSKFTYVGLEIDTTRDAKPRIWFPHTGYPGRDSDKPSQHIVIRLTENAQNDANIAIWQLAHECVHLIDPWDVEVEGRQPSVLEEGLATWYQNTIVQGVPGQDPHTRKPNPWFRPTCLNWLRPSSTYAHSTRSASAPSTTPTFF